MTYQEYCDSGLYESEAATAVRWGLLEKAHARNPRAVFDAMRDARAAAQHLASLLVDADNLYSPFADREHLQLYIDALKSDGRRLPMATTDMVDFYCWAESLRARHGLPPATNPDKAYPALTPEERELQLNPQALLYSVLGGLF